MKPSKLNRAWHEKHRMPANATVEQRFEGRTQTVTIHVLQSDGQYAVSERSHGLPLVSAADLTMFLQRLPSEDDNALLDAFSDWVRQQLMKPQ
jgi:hypothetical protein